MTCHPSLLCPNSPVRYRYIKPRLLLTKYFNVDIILAFCPTQTHITCFPVSSVFCADTDVYGYTYVEEDVDGGNFEREVSEDVEVNVDAESSAETCSVLTAAATTRTRKTFHRRLHLR